MDLQINRLTNNSTQLFKQSISSYSLETKVLVVALIALACLATYIYYTMNTKGSAQKGGTPSNPSAKPDPNVVSKSVQAQKTKLAASDVLKPSDDDDDKSSPPVRKMARPAAQPSKRMESKGASQFDADTQKALALSLHDVPADDEDDLEKALKASKEDFLDDPKALEKAIEASKEEMRKSGDVIVEDDEYEEILKKTKQEAMEKEKEELEKAIELSKKDSKGAPAIPSAALKPPAKPAPNPGATPPTAPAKPAPKPGTTPPPAPTQPKLVIPKQKAAPAVDKALGDTALAKSEVSEHTLNLAVEKAKENPKFRIEKHEVKRNDVDNAYLVLHFPSAVARNWAVEELRSKHSMFKKTGEPNRIDETILEFSVEQTIEFQNAF